MKKNILTSVIIIVVFALVIVTTFLIGLFNVEKLQGVKEDLSNFNSYMVNMDIKDKGDVENIKIDKMKINNSHVRISIIDNNGQITYDSFGLYGDGHLDRIEIKQAIETGEGYAVRYSATTNEKMVYCAKTLENGGFIRCGVVFQSVEIFTNAFIKGSVFIIVLVLIVSITLSMKLTKIIVEPINELENVTSKIADGDLHIRVNSNYKDEIGVLGTTFNKMADQLQGKMNEVMEKQNKLESVLRSMESGVIAVNSNEEVILINPYAKRIFGIKADIEGQKISDYVKDYDINKFLSEEVCEEKEIKLLHPVERELRIKKASIISGENKIGKVIAVQDISDIKRLENMRSQFVANVSHELKTPLTSIKGFAETLRFVEDEETKIKFLDIIDNEADRLSRLISDILVLSKIESEVLVEEEEFYPDKVIEEVLNMLKDSSEKKNISLIFENKNDCILYGDKDRFHQLVLNLVENGIKYSNEGAYVKIKSRVDKDFYYIEVSDNGIGIPKEDVGRIFERFYRVDKSRKGGGTGLGLAIVKHIVKIFRGTLDIKSELGKGTTFYIKLRR